MKNEVYPVGPGDRTGAHLTGVGILLSYWGNLPAMPKLRYEQTQECSDNAIGSLSMFLQAMAGGSADLFFL